MNTFRASLVGGLVAAGTAGAAPVVFENPLVGGFEWKWVGDGGRFGGETTCLDIQQPAAAQTGSCNPSGISADAWMQGQTSCDPAPTYVWGTGTYQIATRAYPSLANDCYSGIWYDLFGSIRTISAGEAIGSGGSFDDRALTSHRDASVNRPALGDYIGLQVMINGQTHFGWIELDRDRDLPQSSNAGIIRGVSRWAYESEPDTPIYAGSTIGFCSRADIAGPVDAMPDGLLTGADFFEFLARFSAGDLTVDFARPGAADQPDGLLTGADFFAFLDEFQSGCR